MTKTPEQVINQQLCACNAGDIDTFMETFHPEIKVYRYPNELRITRMLIDKLVVGKE